MPLLMAQLFYVQNMLLLPWQFFEISMIIDHSIKLYRLTNMVIDYSNLYNKYKTLAFLNAVGFKKMFSWGASMVIYLGNSF